MHIGIIKHGSAQYQKMVELRTEILRKPLGLTYLEAQLAAEISDFLIAAFDYEQILGCCILTPIDSIQIQLRQMAVSSQLQGQGIGAKIITFSEQFAKEKGFKTIVLHARKTALGFYEKLGYVSFGDEYLEVGIPHYSMRKEL
jgi:predicted GNAT family N-acyltransferase